MINQVVEFLSKIIEIRKCINNNKVYVSSECPFCGYKSKKGKRVFRYNSKLKVGKSYCCCKSFKDISYLKHELRYIKWHQDKLSMDYRRFEKSEIVDDDLPF